MNKRLKKLMAQLADRRKSADAILELADAEDRDLTEEEQASFDTIAVQVESINKRIENEKKAIDFQKYEMPTVNDLNTDTEIEQLDRYGDAEEIDVSSIRIPAQARKWIGKLKVFKGDDAEKKAYSFGMYLRAIAGNNGARQWLAQRGFQLEMVYNEGTNAQGGYLVFPEVDRDIIDLVEVYGKFRANARISPMTSETKERPRREGGLTGYYVGEGAAGTESTGSWGLVKLIAKTLMVLTRISNNLNDDAIIDTADHVAREAARAIAEKEDDSGFNGTGTSTYGGIVGVNQRLIDVNGVDDGGGLVLGAGNLLSEITLANFNDVVGILPEYAELFAKWYCSKWVYGHMQKLEAAAGGNTITDLVNGSPVKRFLGYQVEVCQKMPTSNANSQVLALFGDLELAADFGDRKALAMAISDSASVGGESVFERNQMALRITERHDINVHDVGTATVAGPVAGLISAAS
jgi:HK97 family phage major capsid protein